MERLPAECAVRNAAVINSVQRKHPPAAVLQQILCRFVPRFQRLARKHPQGVHVQHVVRACLNRPRMQIARGGSLSAACGNVVARRRQLRAVVAAPVGPGERQTALVGNLASDTLIGAHQLPLGEKWFEAGQVGVRMRVTADFVATLSQLPRLAPAEQLPLYRPIVPDAAVHQTGNDKERCGHPAAVELGCREQVMIECTVVEGYGNGGLGAVLPAQNLGVNHRPGRFDRWFDVGDGPAGGENRRGYQEQPVVEPQVSHFMHVPLRTMVKCPHAGHGSPS